MKVFLRDGSEIIATLNGNNYITKQDVSKLDFSNGNLKEMTVEDEERTDKFTNMTLCNKWDAADGTHLVFRMRTAQELADEKMRANIDYLAMMSEVDLDE